MQGFVKFKNEVDRMETNRLFISKVESARALSLPQQTINYLIWGGDLQAIKMRVKELVTQASLEAFRARMLAPPSEEQDSKLTNRGINL